MKGIIEFNLPEEQEEFDTAVKAADLKAALWEIAQQVFRPARKHGYSDGRIQELLEKADTLRVPNENGEAGYEPEVGTELVSQLEKLFYSILEEYNIEL